MFVSFYRWEVWCSERWRLKPPHGVISLLSNAKATNLSAFIHMHTHTVVNLGVDFRLWIWHQGLRAGNWPPRWACRAAWQSVGHLGPVGHPGKGTKDRGTSPISRSPGPQWAPRVWVRLQARLTRFFNFLVVLGAHRLWHIGCALARGGCFSYWHRESPAGGRGGSRGILVCTSFLGFQTVARIPHILC